jgi:hypothetical protein
MSHEHYLTCFSIYSSASRTLAIFFRIFIRDLDVEFFFKPHNQLNRIRRPDPRFLALSYKQHRSVC